MVIRIAGAILPQNKKIEYALPYIYGVGATASRFIISTLALDPNVRIKDLDEATANKLRDYIEKNYKIEGDLRREVQGNVKRLKEIGSFRGSRHAKRLPARGQRSKTNSRTVRGNVRKTAASGKKMSAQKT